MTDERDQPRRPRAFVLRVLFDADGQLRGQLSEPGSADEWHVTFAGADELWSVFMRRLGVGRAVAPWANAAAHEATDHDKP
jgi:hypothetical protein